MEQKAVQIGIEAGAFHRNRPVDVAIHADAGAALNALTKALKAKLPLSHSGHGWEPWARALRSPWAQPQRFKR